MTRPKDASVTATSFASDDYILIDGATNGSRKILGTNARPGVRGALVKKAADQTAANYTTLTAVAWDAETYDTDNIHSNVTNNTRLTVPSGVTYVRLQGAIELNNHTINKYVAIAFKKNAVYGGAGLGSMYTQTNVTFPMISISSAIIPVTAGDYFELFFQVETDTSVDIVAADSWFSMEIIA